MTKNQRPSPRRGKRNDRNVNEIISHTDIPWECDENCPTEICSSDRRKIPLAICHFDENLVDRVGMDEAYANSAFIVQAVNSHNSLIDACWLAAIQLEDVLKTEKILVATIATELRAAIALARGEKRKAEND